MLNPLTLNIDLPRHEFRAQLDRLQAYTRRAELERRRQERKMSKTKEQVLKAARQSPRWSWLWD